MKIEDQDRIDNYLLNRMSGEERQTFERDMEQDKELREQVEFTKDIQTALKSRNEKLARMQKWQEEMDEEAKRAYGYRATGSDCHYSPKPAMESQTDSISSSRKKRHLIYWVAGIAAIFIIGLFVLPIVTVYESAPVPEEYGVFRGGEDYQEIKQLMEQKDYGMAFSAIEREEHSLEQELLINKKDTTDCEQREYNRMLIEMKQNELTWLKVHALLGLGKESEAMRLLERLRRTEGEYQQAADSLYNQLKN